MAGQEWRAAQEEFGHAPRRTELEFGLRTGNPGLRPQASAADEASEG